MVLNARQYTVHSMADVFNSVFRLDGPNESSIITNNNSEMFATNQTFDDGNGATEQWTTQESFMSEEEIAAFLQMAFSERNFDRRTEAAILSVFVLLITFGVLGNSLVCYVVARNPRMRTPRNVFIINLAISDLTLCLFTQPFNLVKVLTTDWRLGRIVCKLVSMFAGTNVFVSTASITAIALDRYRVIVYPTRQTTKRSGFVVPLASVWLASVVLACPLLVLNDTAVFAPVGDVPLYETCVEDPRMQLEKKFYSVASMLIQYIAPIVVVSAAHAQISRQLKYRMTARKSSSSTGGGSGGGVSAGVLSVFQQQRSVREAKRKRKTDLLLTMISVVYAASWLPLNAFNIMADFHWNVVVVQTYGGGLLVPVCHVLVLCSACTNPLLYGWLNENFRQEFFRAFSGLRCLNPLRKDGADGGGRGRGGGGHGVNSQNSTTFDLTSRRLSTNAAVRQMPAVIS